MRKPGVAKKCKGQVRAGERAGQLEHRLLSQGTQVWFPAPHDSSQTPVTPAPGDPTLHPGLRGHVCGAHTGKLSMCITEIN